MRSASGRFHLGLGKRSNTDDRGDRDREASGSDQGAGGGGDSRVVSGGSSGGGNLGFGGRMGTGALLKGKVAHTAIVSPACFAFCRESADIFVSCRISLGIPN
jgi:hypothetical protein